MSVHPPENSESLEIPAEGPVLHPQIYASPVSHNYSVISLSAVSICIVYLELVNPSHLSFCPKLELSIKYCAVVVAANEAMSDRVRIITIE